MFENVDNFNKTKITALGFWNFHLKVGVINKDVLFKVLNVYVEMSQFRNNGNNFPTYKA